MSIVILMLSWVTLRPDEALAIRSPATSIQQGGPQSNAAFRYMFVHTISRIFNYFVAHTGLLFSPGSVWQCKISWLTEFLQLARCLHTWMWYFRMF